MPASGDHNKTAEALALLKSCWYGTTGAYAHSGRFIMPSWQFNNIISPAKYAAAAEQWIKIGAATIGGGCGIGPAHIRDLKKRCCL